MNNLRCRHAWKHKEDEEEEKKLEMMIQTKHENHQRHVMKYYKILCNQ